MTQAILRGQMGVLDKLGQGGQGVVYRAPGVRSPYAKSMVYKEYKKATLASLDVNALKAMPDFLESLVYRDGAELIGMAAWPCRVVEDGGVTTGFVMPAISDEFFCDFWTSNAVAPSRVMAEFQHLLNDPQVVVARFGGTGISEREKYELLRQVASALLFLHERGVCVGDISPKNLLFALSPSAAVYFIDCDAMRVKGVSLFPQVETPGWGVPAGEEKATVFSDRYKLGLLALRLLVGDQDARDPARLPGAVPSWLRTVIADTLTVAPGQRPDLGLWQAALDHAIPNASRQAPTVARTHRPPPAPKPPPPSAPKPPKPPPPPPLPSLVVVRSNKLTWLMIPAALLALFVIVKVASGPSGGPTTTSASSVTATSKTADGYTPTRTSTSTVTSTLVSVVTQTPDAPSPSPLTQSSTASRMVLSDADNLGFVIFDGAARCSAGDGAAVIMRTPQSALVVCKSPNGGAYYRGLRLRDRATIQLTNIVVSDSGSTIVVTNSEDGTRYEISNTGLEIVKNGEVLGSETAIEFATPQP